MSFHFGASLIPNGVATIVVPPRPISPSAIEPWSVATALRIWQARYRGQLLDFSYARMCLMHAPWIAARSN
jgi:hypothetical protein